jgi:hypothetical protein
MFSSVAGTFFMQISGRVVPSDPAPNAAVKNNCRFQLIVNDHTFRTRVKVRVIIKQR